MVDAEALLRATNLPPKVLEDHGLRSALASRLPTSLPPRALVTIALKQRAAALKQERGLPEGNAPCRAAVLPRAASLPKATAPPTTPEPKLELPMLRTNSSGDVPAIVCPPSMQPVTPRALCKPLSAAPCEPADSCCKAAAAPAAAGHPAWATARRPLLALGLQLALLPLLLSSLHAVLGGPAKAPDASLGSIRTWWIACSCTATLLLLCAHAAYAKLGWRMGMALDGLTLVLRAAACHTLACLLPSAAILLMCRLLLSGCALACPAGVTKAPKGTSVASPDLHVQRWSKA